MVSNKNSIDLLKFTGSIFVFFMHLCIWGNYQSIQFLWEVLARWAVPFFFISSSYFLFRKETDNSLNELVLKRYIKRIAVLYLVWFIFNIPSILWLKFHFEVNNYQSWISFIKELLLSSSFLGSWYLLSSIFSALLLFILSKHLRTKWCLVITSVPFLLCLMTSCYGGFLPDPISSSLLWLCFPCNIFGGAFYFAIGKWIYEHQHCLTNRSAKEYIVFAVASFAFYVGEIIITNAFGILKTTDFSIGLVPLSASLFIYGLKASGESANFLAYRKSSIIIYCSQGNIICAAAFLAKLLAISSSIIRGAIGIALMAVLVISILFLQRKFSHSWIALLT